MANVTSAMIRAKREAKKAERAALDADYKAALQRLIAEEAELEIAERVVSGFDDEPVSTLVGAEVAPRAGPMPPPSPPPPASGAHSGGKNRPDGVPPLPELIETVLRDAHRQGRISMEPKEIRKEVARRWWPDVKDSSVGSVAWRMWTQKRLAKDGALYSLPTKGLF